MTRRGIKPNTIQRATRLDKRNVSASTLSSSYGSNITSVRTRRNRGILSSPKAAWATQTKNLRREYIASCRDQYYSNPIFQRVINALVEHIVSEGFRIHPNTADPGWNKAARDILRERFQRGNYTPRGMASEWEIAKNIIMNRSIDGGVFVYRPKGGTQLFEEPQVYTPADKWGKNDVLDGIQFDERGHLKGYWVGPYSMWGDVDQTNMQFIPAWHIDEDFQIKMPVTNYLRVTGMASSYRGTPLLAASVDDLERMTDVFDSVAERVAQEACIMGTLKSDDVNAKQSFNVARNDEASAGEEETSMQYDDIQYVEPGIVAHLRSNDNFEMHSPSTPSNNFNDFVKMSARVAALPASMPIEVALMHFSDTNFSAARGAIELYKMACKMDKKLLADEYSTWNYMWTIYEAMLDGDLTYRDDWFEHRVGLSGWRYLEPKKDAEAAATRMENSLSTLTGELADRGLEFEDEARTAASEVRTAERLSEETGVNTQAILDRAYERNGGQRPTSADDNANSGNGNNNGNS